MRVNYTEEKNEDFYEKLISMNRNEKCYITSIIKTEMLKLGKRSETVT